MFQNSSPAKGGGVLWDYTVEKIIIQRCGAGTKAYDDRTNARCTWTRRRNQLFHGILLAKVPWNVIQTLHVLKGHFAWLDTKGNETFGELLLSLIMFLRAGCNITESYVVLQAWECSINWEESARKRIKLRKSTSITDGDFAEELRANTEHGDFFNYPFDL